MHTPSPINLTPPPKPAVVYSWNHIDAEFIRIAVNAGYPIKAVVIAGSSSVDDAPDFGVPLLRETDPFDASGMDVIPTTYLADVPEEGVAAYRHALAWAPATARILHPAATIPYFRPAYSGLCATIGYPGSGNVVLQSIITRLQELNKLDYTAGYEFFCRRLARNHSFFLRGFIDDVFSWLKPFEANFAVGRTELAGCRLVTPDGGFIHIEGLPFAGYIGKNFGGHSTLTPNITALLRTLGYRIIFLARDPVRTLVSNANKTVRPASILLNDETWLSQNSYSVVEYYKALQGLEESLDIVRYEDLLADPGAFIMRCAATLGLRCSDADAQKIWAEVGSAELTPAGREHYNNPRAERSSELSQTIVETMEKHGVRDLSERLGYGWFDTRTLPRNVGTKVKKPKSSTSPLYGNAPTLFSDHLELPGMTCAASSKELFERAVECLRKPENSRSFNMLGTMIVSR